jgi:glycosyltransferase involved in cell wall biosynthesis
MTPTRPAGEPPQTSSLSVIIPVLDEAPSLPELHRKLREALGEEAELIYVDDGSRDASPEALRKIAAADSRARVLRLRRHLGKSQALLAGFARARGRWIATIDADLQEDPAEIGRLLSVLQAEGYDLVGGWRRLRLDPPGRVLGSRLFNAAVSLAGGAKFRDINCGLKVMRREVVEEVQLASGFHRFIPLLAHWKGFRVAEREVAHRARGHGRSRYGGERILHGLVDLAVIGFLVRSEHRPSRFFIALGMGLGLAGFAICAHIAYLRLALGTIQSRYPWLALGVLLVLAGIQVTTLGFFSELIAYHFRAGRPPAPAVEETAAEEPAGRRAEEEVSP